MKLATCPLCGKEPFNDRVPFGNDWQVACECGLSAPTDKDENGAAMRWASLCSRLRTSTLWTSAEDYKP